jgi:type II secretory pathway pseudopilin PulG
MGSHSATRPHRNDQRGYVLITLILFVALLAIGMTALAPVIAQQMKRDREEELIHRGVQYSRAIKHYVKKFGRYPTKIEDLESTNNLRFLRKAYKDPITGKDFKILRMGDVQMSFGPGIAGATSAATLATQSGGLNGNGSFGNNSAFGANNFAGGTFGSTTGSMNANGPQAPGQDNSGTNPDQSQGTPGANPGQAGQENGGANKVFGGGPIVGVASISKDKTIRVFNKKDRYYQWQFIYDPSTDRGGLLATPNQPGLQSFAGAVQQGAPATQGGQPNSPFGAQGSPFGAQGSAFGSQGSPFGFQGGPQMPAGGMQPGAAQPPVQQQPQFPPDQAPQ